MSDDRVRFYWLEDVQRINAYKEDGLQDNVNSPIVIEFTNNSISEENWPSKKIITSYLEYIQITYRTYELCKCTSIHLLYVGRLYKCRNGH